MIQRIKQYISTLLGKHQQENHVSSFLVNASIRLFILQCSSLALGFLLNFLLVKTVALKEYGTYVYLFNLLNLLVSFCLFGVDTLLVKMTAVYTTLGKLQNIKGILLFSALTVLLGSFLTAFISTAVLPFFRRTDVPVHTGWFVLVFASLLMLSVTTASQSILQGLNKVIRSQIAEKIAKPLLMIIVFAILYYRGKTASFNELIWINLSATAIVMVFTFIFLRNILNAPYKKVTFAFETRSWLTSVTGFFAMNILYALNSRVNIFLLGIIKGDEAVGVFNVVARLGELMGFILSIINFVVAPLTARLYKQGDIKSLQQVVTLSARVVFFASLPLVVLLVLFRKQVLLLFGVSFLTGQSTLVILCLGQLLNILLGSVGTLLIMSGNQRFSILSLGISLIVNIALTFLFTPRYGIAGTALATSISLGIWNVLMYFFVRKKLHIRTTALGVI